MALDWTRGSVSVTTPSVGRLVPTPEDEHKRCDDCVSLGTIINNAQKKEASGSLYFMNPFHRNSGKTFNSTTGKGSPQHSGAAPGGSFGVTGSRTWGVFIVDRGLLFLGKASVPAKKKQEFC